MNGFLKFITTGSLRFQAGGRMGRSNLVFSFFSLFYVIVSFSDEWFVL